MKLINGYKALPAEVKGAVVVIGNFDGVHKGHLSIIAQAKRIAESHKVALGVLTFEPHPRVFFSPDAPPFRLMTAPTKARKFEAISVDYLYQLNFDAALASLHAREFAQDILAKGLGVRHVIVGRDFRFGKNREGSVEHLIQFGREMGFDVSIIELIEKNEEVISSTAIRKALRDGRPEDAALMLGDYHRIEGEVQHGDARGRELGFPTANIALQGLHHPKFGIYAVLADVLTGAHQGHYKAVASLGERPTFGDYIPNLETFIFDFEGDLYGEELSIALVAFQRAELKFDGIAPLIEQMKKDCEIARDILNMRLS